jgi:hypothetical protein
MSELATVTMTFTQWRKVLELVTKGLDATADPHAPHPDVALYDTMYSQVTKQLWDQRG